MRLELRLNANAGPTSRRQTRRSCWSGGGGCGIRTREGVNPTRFPSVRHRPLGESSASEHSRVELALDDRTTLDSGPRAASIL
jgi:hypothetical protein